MKVYFKNLISSQKSNKSLTEIFLSLNSMKVFCSKSRSLRFSPSLLPSK